jgi:diguanylate cyclase (GGDEF)-like protein/PAS domain S-box-containing protein
MALPRILFVDDEEEILRSIQREFHFEPLEILTATSAVEALNILARENVDVIVSDDRMPGMTGSELLAEVNRLYPEICKIMLTGHGNFTSAVRTINEARIYRFLLKPVSGEDLIGIIHHALQERSRTEDLLTLSQQVGNVCTCTIRFDDEGLPAAFLWSKNTCSLLGMKTNEPLDSWEILERHLHREDRERVASFYKSCLYRGVCTDIEFRVVLGHGLIRWISQTSEISRDARGEPVQLLFILKDITEDKRYREWLEEQAFQDNLTGLGNRALLFRFLEEAFCGRTAAGEVAVIFLDLDDFKLINDSLGHQVGDWLLRAFAERLQKTVPAGITTVRLGGDEFALLFHGPNAQAQAEKNAKHILQALNDPFLIQEYKFHISASIGVAGNISSDCTAEEVLRNADTAMYAAKSQGKRGYQVFDQDMHNRTAERFALLADMRKALTDGQIFPFFQPIISLDNMELAGYEALARWQHPARGMVMPSLFIPIAEESGLITSLGMTIMDIACAQARQWQRKFSTAVSSMSINVSSLQFRQQDLAKHIIEVLKRHRLDPRLLKIEITESGIMEDVELSLSLMDELTRIGVRLQIDDFGTGYSSLSYLRKIPAESIKVDQSFVIGMEADAEKQAIVKTIINLALSLGLKVVAEGIETVDQLALLRSYGCHYGQGFLFDQPLSPEEAVLRRDYSRFVGHDYS